MWYSALQPRWYALTAAVTKEKVGGPHFTPRRMGEQSMREEQVRRRIDSSSLSNHGLDEVGFDRLRVIIPRSDRDRRKWLSPLTTP